MTGRRRVVAAYEQLGWLARAVSAILRKILAYSMRDGQGARRSRMSCLSTQRSSAPMNRFLASLRRPLDGATAKSRPPIWSPNFRLPVAAIDGRMYCETANRLSLATPVLAEAFPEAKFIWLIRDGRNFVSVGTSGVVDPNRVAIPLGTAPPPGDRLGDVEPDVWKAWSPFRKSAVVDPDELIENDLAAMPETRS